MSNSMMTPPTEAASAAAEDWQATCMIYTDDDDDEDNDSDTTSHSKNKYHTTTTLDNQGGFLRGSIVLTFLLGDYVFCRRDVHFDSQRPRFRFWTLHTNKNSNKCNKSHQEETKEVNHSNHQEEEPRLQFRLVFWGPTPSPTTTANVTREDEADELLLLYNRVDLALLSDYPHSFPQELKPSWLQWLQTTANTMLMEEQISYSVCNFVQHQAMDFFSHFLHDGTRNLVCFDDNGPTYYDVPTLLPGKTVKKIFPLQRRHPNGSSVFFHDTSPLYPNEQQLIVPLLLKWRDWLPVQCPICFDTVSPQLAVILTPCHHGFCKTCMTTYLRLKAQDELHSANSNNPFTCPVPKCQQGMKIVGFVKPFLTRELMDKVRHWYQDIKHPPCYALPQCLKRTCSSRVLRKEAVDSDMIFCELCHGRWCELCLQRAPRNAAQSHEDTPALCKYDLCIELCERYLAANDNAKAKCEAKMPWIKHYAKSRIQDHSITKWIQDNGQVCPGCKTGIERQEGCFHMSCPCGTHFCYECGEQIFPPYYGTHHCWERDNNNNNHQHNNNNNNNNHDREDTVVDFYMGIF